MEILLDTLKWSAIVGAIALALTMLKPLLDRRYSPKWRYGVWLALSALLLLAPVQWETLIPDPAAPPVVIEVPQVEVSLSREEGIRLQRPASSENTPRPSTPAAEPVPVPDLAPEPVKTVSLDQVLTVVWLAGMGLFAAYHLLGTLLFCRRARRWSRRPNEETRALYAAVCRDMGLKKAPPVRISEQVGSPMMVGLLRPRLLLPGEDYGARELCFILRHELTHYRRRDLWYKLAVLAANAVHWFNPLIYLLAREASADMELTCDDAVVAGEGAEVRRAYSETLLASLHRQRGGAVLSTHFYGGKQVMRERFRNILGQRGRKWGGLVLALTLVLTLAAACAFGISQAQGPEDLTAEELAEWQEKLNSLEWNGFVTSMYTDVRNLFPETLFYNGAGISRGATEEERAGLEARWGGEIDTDVQAFSVADIDKFLEEHTNITRAEFAASGYTGYWTSTGRTWAELESTDTYFLVHGDTTYTSVNVTAGQRDGDTLTLEVAAESELFSNGLSQGTLTLVDGKVTSFTAPLYSAVETAARDVMEGDAATYIQQAKEYGDKDLQFTDQYINSLYCGGSYKFDEYGGKTYYPWRLEYRLKPDDPENVFLVGGMSLDDNGYLTEDSSVGSPVLIFSMDENGEIAREQTTYTANYLEEGLTLEEYIYCNVQLGMELSGILNGWPEIDTPFLDNMHNGHETWVFDWQDVANSYVDRFCGVSSHEGWVVRQNFDGRNDHDQAMVVRAISGGRTVNLLLAHVNYDGLSFWQVCGEASDPETLGEDGEELFYRTRFSLTDGPDAPLCEIGVYGEQKEYNCAVRTLSVTMDGTSYPPLSVSTASMIVNGENGEEEAELSQYNMEDWLILKDVNFDGYCDIGLQAATPAYNRPYYFWLYNPESGQYEFGFWILGPIEDVDAHNGVLTCETHSGPIYYTEYYTYDEQGSLYLFRRDVEELFDGGRTYTEEFDKASNDRQGGSYYELTREELRSFEDYFNRREHNGLLRFPNLYQYTWDLQKELTPYLSLMFYDLDSGIDDSMTDNQKAAIDRVMTEHDMDVRVLTTEYIADYLSRNFIIGPEEAEELLAADRGVTERQLGVYIPECDAYCSYQSDTMMQLYTFDSGMRFSDLTVTLYSNSDVYVYEDGEYVLHSDASLTTVLEPYGDGWCVRLNYITSER